MNTALNQSGSCQKCVISPLCTPRELPIDEASRFHELMKERMLVAKGASVYMAQSQVDKIFIVRRGSFKSELALSDGRTQVMGFHLPGDILNIESLSGALPQLNAIAMEDGEICSISLVEFDSIIASTPALRYLTTRLLTTRIGEGNNLKMSIGSLCAEEKISGFLINWIARLTGCGHLNKIFLMNMTQKEIGSYLGLEYETVSRIFTRLSNRGLIYLKNRQLQLLDASGLLRTAGDAQTLFWHRNIQNLDSPFHGAS